MGKFADVKTAWKRDTTPYFIFAAVAFAFGDLLFGVDTGSFGSIQALPSFLRRFAPLNPVTGKYAFPTQTKSIMNSMIWPSKLAGCVVYEPLVGRFGYKIAMYIVAVLQCIALAVELAATSWQMFNGGRVIAYFAVGIVEAAVSTYLAEISPASLRGFFTGIMNCVVALGNLWGAGMGRAFATEQSDIGWRVPVAVQFIPAIAMLIMVPFCPESPRYLLSKGRREQALKNLNRLRPKHEVEAGITIAEVDAIETMMREEVGNFEGKWLDLFRPRYIKRTAIGALLFFGNQFNGNQFINLYGPTQVSASDKTSMRAHLNSFFNSVGLQAKSFTYTTMITAISIVFSILAICLVDLTGRRPLLLVGIGLATVFNAVVGGVGSKENIGDTEINAIVASLVMVAIGNKIGVNPLSWLVVAEIGGVRMRKKLMAFSTVMDVLYAFAISYSIPYLLGTPGANLSARVGFVFMAWCGATWILTYLLVPEVTGRSLEEVDELFDRGLWGWQFAKAETTGTAHQLAMLEHSRGEILQKGSESIQEDIAVSDDHKDLPPASKV